MPPVPDMTDTVPAARAEQTLFLLGGYTDKSVLAHAPQGGEGSGFYSVIFDPEAAKFQRLTSSEVRTNPAFIMKHPELDVVYMTTEVITKDGSEVLVGKLDRSAIASRISHVFMRQQHLAKMQTCICRSVLYYAYFQVHHWAPFYIILPNANSITRLRSQGSVTITDRKRVHGRSTCHISWDVARTHLIAVSYWDSKITTFPVCGETGALGEAAEVYSDPGAAYVDTHSPDRWEHLAHRQRWPHLHQVNLCPFTRRVFLVPDLGRDMIQLFSIQDGRVTHLGSQQLRRGLGPRHLEFSRAARVVYVCGELDNTVTVLRYNAQHVDLVTRGGYSGDAGAEDQSQSLLSHVQTVSSVPSKLDTKSTIAEMRLHPSGR